MEETNAATTTRELAQAKRYERNPNRVELLDRLQEYFQRQDGIEVHRFPDKGYRFAIDVTGSEATYEVSVANRYPQLVVRDKNYVPPTKVEHRMLQMEVTNFAGGYVVEFYGFSPDDVSRAEELGELIHSQIRRASISA